MARKPKPLAKVTKGKRLNMKIWVGRTQGTQTFSACTTDRKTWGGFFCVRGKKNPRRAVAALYRAAAARLSRRSGAFAGKSR